MIRKLIVIALIPLLFHFIASSNVRHLTPEVPIQNEALQERGPKDNIFLMLTSPHDIARYINEYYDQANLNDLWSKFSLETMSGKPGRCGCRGYDCPGTCKAEIIPVDLDSSQDDLLILRISYAGDAYCWFLVFKKMPDWRVIGVVESLENQYRPPRHRVARHGTQRWLVVNELCGRGTGFVNYVERWYQLSSEVPREVLSYGVSGHSVQGENTDYEFKSEVNETDGDSSYRIVVQYTLLRKPVYQPTLRWVSSESYKAIFVWDSVLEQFTLDRKSSDLPRSQESPIIRNINRRQRTN